jgi:hypothetical protein
MCIFGKGNLNTSERNLRASCPLADMLAFICGGGDAK